MATKQKSLANALHDRRVRLGLSQNQAYKQLGVSRLTFRQWEKGTWEQIRLRYAPRLAEFLDEYEEDTLERMGVLTNEAAEAIRRARKRGTVRKVVNLDNLTGWETGRYINWLVSWCVNDGGTTAVPSRGSTPARSPSPTPPRPNHRALRPTPVSPARRR